MTLSKYASVLVSLFVCTLLFTAQSSAADYQHSVTADKMRFDWSINGDVLAVKLTAPTKGWVGIGFNPSKKMKDADFIVGYVKGGKVSIFDEFGTQATQHGQDTKRGGNNDVTVVGGSEQGKQTTLEFTIPVKSGDSLDATLDLQGDTVVLLAYGPDRDSTRMKHTYHKAMIVNLSNGSVKE
ncbi:DOMON domain-containing protein [Desulfogranum marinum]|uniref:DOMON domain-containing protein n=1 Tax=Desulfogranum marinum TaxID=453220 RepID=UPI001965378C|nr:DOMON domain-containing protein [Desulfogranum marinum]MBM9513514.1 hypothetical protein [Desulfogranum marinum]